MNTLYMRFPTHSEFTIQIAELFSQLFLVMNNVQKKMDKENKKRVSIALWRANPHLKDIRSERTIPEKALRRIFGRVRGGQGEEGAVKRKVGSGFSRDKVDDDMKKIAEEEAL